MAEPGSPAAEEAEPTLFIAPMTRQDAASFGAVPKESFLSVQTLRRGDSTRLDYLMALVLRKFFCVSTLLPPVPRLMLTSPYSFPTEQNNLFCHFNTRNSSYFLSPRPVR